MSLSDRARTALDHALGDPLAAREIGDLLASISHEEPPKADEIIEDSLLDDEPEPELEPELEEEEEVKRPVPPLSHGPIKKLRGS